MKPKELYKIRVAVVAIALNLMTVSTPPSAFSVERRTVVTLLE